MSGGTDDPTGGSEAFGGGTGSAAFATSGAAATTGWLGGAMGCGLTAGGWLARSVAGGCTGLLTATSVRSGAGGGVPWPASPWPFVVCGAGAGGARGREAGAPLRREIEGPAPTSRRDIGDSGRLGDSGIWEIEGRERRVQPGSGHCGVVRPGAARAPRFRAVTRRAAAGARTPAAARVWRNPREPESC